MRLALLFALILPFAAVGKESAYQALRVVSTERSPELLKNVIEVKGRNGSPQPTVWTVLINDPLARGGVREIEVSKGHIISERTPVKTYSGQADGNSLDFQKLNLDSEGVFFVIEGEARVAKVQFYTVDYLLRSGEAGSAPVWVVQLLDDQQHSVGSVTVAADTGLVITKTLGGKTSAKGSWAAGGGLKGRLVRFGDTMGRTFRKVGGDVEEFFTGDRTVDQPKE